MRQKIKTGTSLIATTNGAILNKTYAALMAKGDNHMSVAGMGKDVSSADIDVIESGKTPFKSLILQEAKIDPDDNNASLVIESTETQAATFNVPTNLNNVRASIKHRLALREDGTCELASKATIKNTSEHTPVPESDLTIVIGDTSNKGVRGPMMKSLEFARSDTTNVEQVNETIYRYDHPRKIQLGPEQDASLNLFAKDFEAGYDKELSLVSQWGSYNYEDSRTRPAGPVNTTYTVENTEENGLGQVLPGGSVDIVLEDGSTLEAQTANVSVKGTMILDGGQAFDIKTTRQQTSYVEGEPLAEVAPNSRGFLVPASVGQAIEIDNKAQNDKTIAIEVTEHVPQSPGERDTVVKNVKVDGEEVPFKFDADQSTFTVSVPVAGDSKAKLTFDVDFVDQRYR